MDPITLATIVATLIAKKAVEKVGEKIGEYGIKEGVTLLEALRRKAPETVKRMEAVADPNAITNDAEIVEEVRKVADAEPEVQAAVMATANAVQQQFGGVINQAQLAEKIGMVFQGGYNPITIEKFEF